METKIDFDDIMHYFAVVEPSATFDAGQLAEQLGVDITTQIIIAPKRWVALGDIGYTAGIYDYQQTLAILASTGYGMTMYMSDKEYHDILLKQLHQISCVIDGVIPCHQWYGFSKDGHIPSAVTNADMRDALYSCAEDLLVQWGEHFPGV